MNDGTPILEAVDAALSMDGAVILKDVNLSVASGRIYAVVGPNGAGKSTLIRLLCLLIRPSRGTIRVEGQDAVRAWPDVLPLRRRLALVTQAPTMFRTGVFENVASGLKFRGLPSREVREKVEEALHFVSMGHLLKRHAPSLSMGEAQMIALARAFVVNPAVLLLDEPTSSLDPLNTRRWEDHVLRINRERGATVVMVTHSLKQAERLAHDAVFLYGGGIVETGDVQSFFSHPTREETRRFLQGELFS